MDPKVTRLRVAAFDAVKNADGRHQNVQKYGFDPSDPSDRSSGDVLSIERVMHGARDLPRRLLEPPED
jgi:hypothetical protein